MSHDRTTDLQRHAEVFQALSNPHRLRIFLRLASCCAPGVECDLGSEPGMHVSELGSELGIGASTVSHHIKELRRSGLIRCERRGQRVECSVDLEALDALAGFFSQWAAA